MFRGGVGYSAGILLGLCALLSGCATGGSNGVPHPLPAAGKQGIVHGGEEPVSGATIQLYAVGTNALGSPATPLISSAVLTDANGNFTITGTYTCPSASALVYLTATGGNPGLPAGTNNSALALIAALGPCSTLSPSTFISLNELTTVAAVYALAPYMTSLSSVGSDSGNATALTNAFALANQLVNTTTGTAPGTNVPAGTLVPVQQINTIADILASCVNTAGGVAGDTTACGSLFSITTIPAASTAPTNTVAALLQIANHPTVNTAALYALIPATAPFQPAQPQVPPDLSVRLQSNAGLTVSPTVLNFPATRAGTSTAQTITITNNTAAPIGLDALDAEQYSITGTDVADFSVYNGPSFECPTPLMPGASCTMQITFRPTAIGPRTAYYILPNTSANPSIAVALNGTGLEATAGPASLSPGTLNLTAPGTPSPLTLTNSGTGPLTIDGIAISSDPTSGQPAFTQTNTCGASLAPAATCTIAITALATTQVYSTGVLTVYDDAASGPQTANLSYSNGFTGPLLLNFPSISVGTSYTDYLNQIQPYPNPVTLTITGPDATDFSFSATSSVQTATCSSYSRPPTDCSNPIIFSPSAAGVRTATLNVVGNQFNGPYGGLVGIGLPPGLDFAVLNVTSNLVNATPLSSLQYGYITLGQTQQNMIQILNNGTVPVTLNPVTFTGPAASEFTATSACTAALAPGGTCRVTIFAQPTQPGVQAATMNLTDSTNTASATVSLQAIGVYAGPVVNPSPLAFPYTPEGSTSAPLTFTITANNNDPVFLRIDQDGPTNPFVLTNGNSCPQTPCQLSAVYQPTSATIGNSGNSGTTFYVYDLFTLAPTQLAVTGTYLPPYVVSASPTSLSFGTQPFGTLSNAQTVTLTNNGSQTLNFTLAFSPDGSVTTDPNFMAGGSSGQYYIYPGQTFTVSVEFYPTVLGPDTATLYIISSAPTSPIAISLSGTGT